MNAHGEPSALSIVRRWLAQRLEDEERNLQQERELIAEEHFRTICAAGRVTNNSAEVHYRHMKRARAELVSCIKRFLYIHAHVRIPGVCAA